jgi:MFS family permease
MLRLRDRFASGGAASAALTAPFVSTVLISFLLILGVTIVAPLLPVIVDEYGVSRAGAGMLLSSFAIGRLAFDIVAGVLGDRFGIRRVTLVACLLTITSSLFAATAPPYEWLLAARVGQGIGSALYMTVAMRHVMDLAPEGHVGRLLAIYQGVVLAGVSAGPIVGGVVAQFAGLSGTFLLYGAFGVAGLVVAWLLLPKERPTGRSAEEPATTPERSSTLVRRLLADPTFLLVLFATFAIFWARSGVGSTMLPLLASERFAFSETAIGTLLTALVVGNLLVIAHAGRSVDRAGRRSQLIRSMAVTAPIIAGFALITAPWALFAAAALIGGVKGYASVVPGVVVSDLADKRVRGTAVGIQRMMTDLGILLGPVSAGALVDRWGFTTAFVAAGVGIGVVALAVTFMRETGPIRPAAPLYRRLASLTLRSR